MAHRDLILAGEIRETKNEYDLVYACTEETEISFTWTPCDLCKIPLGGERHRGALIKPGTKEVPIYLNVCQCCIEYIANGELCDCP